MAQTQGDHRDDNEESRIARLRGTIPIECGYGRRTAEAFRSLLGAGLVATLGAYNGQQAIQYVKAGLSTVYVSGWQVAAAHNTAREIYPDQSLYPVDSMPAVIEEMVRALRRADQIQSLKGGNIKYEVPLIADGEAGFGGSLHAYELTRRLIEAGAAAVHFEDQSPAAKKCGHLGGKVLIPTSQMIRILRAARLASKVLSAPTVVIARTDAESASFIASDIDPNDRQYIDSSLARTSEGYFHHRAGLEASIHRALAYAPHADILWFETSRPSLEEAERFARAIHARYPKKWLAYNCSPSFRWALNLPGNEALRTFQQDLYKLGYVFQFVTLGAYHSTNLASFRLASEYKKEGMLAYSKLQELELSASPAYTGARHQTEAGVIYFDAIGQLLGETTNAFGGSTEQSQF